MTCEVSMIFFAVGEEGESDVGFYLYDLDSSHGTYHNGKRCFPRRYYRLRVGHTVKLAGSTRLLVVQGPEEDMERESEHTVTELKQIARKKEEEKRRLEEEESRRREEEEKEKEKDTGITWGMREDAVEEEDDEEEEAHPDMSKNPFSRGLSAGGPGQNEHLYSEDPKRALRRWFEREGFELEFRCEEKGPATFQCRVELPLDAVEPGTTAETAEATVKGGKKKEAVAQCALEACRILDRRGLLGREGQKARERRAQARVRKLEEDDFYGSDDDEFLDRTGSIERKRRARMRMAGKEDRESRRPETYETLTEKLSLAESEVALREKELEAVVAAAREKTGEDEKEEEEEDLDAYMARLRAGGGASADKESVRKLKRTLAELRKEVERLRRLAEIARPTALPALAKPEGETEKRGAATVLIGRRGGPGRMRTLARPLPPQKPSAEKEKQAKSEGEVEKVDPVKTEDNHKEGEAEGPVKSDEAVDPGGSPVVPLAEEEGKEVQVVSETSSMKGPFIPAHLREALQSLEEEGAKEETAKRTRGDRGRKRRKAEEEEDSKKKSKSKEGEEEEELDADYADVCDPDYAVWKPPQGQSGDGRTSLNEKYGY